MPPFLQELKGWLDVRVTLVDSDPDLFNEQIEKVDEVIRSLINGVQINQTKGAVQ